MPMNVRFDGALAVLSNFGRLMNDPRYIDAGRDLRALLDEGHRSFVIDLADVREMSDTSLGLLTTLTRQIRQRDGEVVLLGVKREVKTYLDEMLMDDYWEQVDNLDAARDYLDEGED